MTVSLSIDFLSTVILAVVCRLLMVMLPPLLALIRLDLDFAPPVGFVAEAGDRLIRSPADNRIPGAGRGGAILSNSANGSCSELGPVTRSPIVHASGTTRIKVHTDPRTHRPIADVFLTSSSYGIRGRSGFVCSTEPIAKPVPETDIGMQRIVYTIVTKKMERGNKKTATPLLGAYPPGLGHMIIAFAGRGEGRISLACSGAYPGICGGARPPGLRFQKQFPGPQE